MKRFLALMSRPAVVFARRSKSLFGVTTAINAFVLLPFLQACTIAPVQTSSVLPVLESSSKVGQGTAKSGEADLLTTASAAFAKGQPIANSLASLAADTPDFAPPGAGSTGNVDPATGKLTFGVPLAGIGGGTTPSFTLGLSYSSASVYETAINWNYEQVPGEVGLGWSLPAAHMRIARLPGSTGVAYDNSFMLMTGTAGYRLALVGYDQPNNVKYYETNDGDFARLEFHDNSAGDPGTPESSSYWVLTDATGIKYYYGWAYRAQDGASSTDADFASFCTDLESGPIFQAEADDCEFGPAELDVRWGSWTGVSYDTVNQEQFASSWYLSAIENTNGLRTTLYYGRHTQQVGQQKMSNPERTAVPKTFGKATYLYKVVTDDGSQMTLDWASRTATEILDPRQYNSEPDGYQEKYQALYLSQVDTFDGGIAAPNGGWATAPTPVSQAALGYNNGVLLGFDNPEQLMGKRILTAVTPSEYNFAKAADGDAAPFDPQPSYAFGYWGQNTVQQTENGATLSNDDGVSVSRWNDDQGFNAHKGALYGLIKSVTSPLGATTTYQYTNAQGTLVQRTLEVDDLAPYTEVNANRHAYVGSGYVLLSTDVTAPGSTDVHNGFFIFAWTSTGWQRVVSEVSRGYYSGFTLQSDMDTYPNAFDFVSMGNGMVGVSLPNGLTNSAGHACNDVFVYQQQRSQETWAAIGDNSDANSPYFGSHCGNTRVAVSNDTVGIVAGADQNWNLWHSNNGWQQSDGTTHYSGTFSRTYSGQDIPVATQIGEGFAGFYFAPPPGNEQQDIVAALAFIKDSGVQESSPGQANVVVTTAQIGQQFGVHHTKNNGTSWLDLTARAIYPQGSSLNLIVALGAQRVYNSYGKGAVETGDYYYSPTFTMNAVVRGEFVATANSTVSPLPADQTPIDYAADNGGQPFDYIQFTVLPPAAQVSQAPADYVFAPSENQWVSDAISTGMMVGIANWATYTWQSDFENQYGSNSQQDQQCGAAIATPTGFDNSAATTYPGWDNFGTSPSDEHGNACFFGETTNKGAYSDPDLYSSDDVFALLRGDGGGYSTWVHDALNETIDSDQYATMTYYPPRLHGPMQSKAWQAFDGIMEIVGIGLLASGWGSAAGAALTGEMLTAASEGVLSAAFTAQMVVPMYAHERITGGPLSNYAASRRIFFFGENFWVRNADESLSPVALPNNADSQSFRPSNIPSDMSLLTAVSGTIANYTPLTYSNGQTASPINATYLFEFWNGDVRRTNDGTFAPADVPQIFSASNWSSENPNVDSDNLTGDAAFILYDQGPNSQSFSARAGNEFMLFAVVDHASTGEVTDKVVSSVTTDDGIKQTRTTFAYAPDLGQGTSGRYSLSGSTGLYAQTTVFYQGTQETIFVSGAGCLTSANSAAISLDATCTGATATTVSTRFLMHADGRIESLASPGQCMLANSSGAALTLASCDPSNAAQLFALYDLPDATQPFALKSIGLSTAGDLCTSVGATMSWTSCVQPDESQVLQIGLANADNSGRAAGTTIVYSYAGSSANRSVIDATGVQAAIPGYAGAVDFDSTDATRPTTPWTTYFGELLGSAYRSESYRAGQSAPFRTSDTVHEVVDLVRSGAYDGGLTRRLSRAAWITDTNDGVETVSAAEYNGLSQLRATHISTQKAVTAADESGNVSLVAQTIRSAKYTYYAWEVPAYSAAMLAANRLSDIYETFGTVSDDDAAPEPVLANVTTYTQVNREVDGASVMLPLATYQGRGNDIAVTLPQMVIGYSPLVSTGNSNGQFMAPDMDNGDQGNWGCLVATEANGQANLSINGACADVEGASAGATGAVYTTHKIVNPLDTQDASGNYHTLWLLESQTVPGQCLTYSADGSTGFGLSPCNFTNVTQKFGLETEYLQNYGFYTTFNLYLPENGGSNNMVLRGFRDDSGSGFFAPPWTTAGTTVPEFPLQGDHIFAARAIAYPAVELGIGSSDCLYGVGASLTMDGSCATSTPRDSTWLLHANGMVESNGTPNLCFTAGAEGISVNQACAIGTGLATFRLLDKWYDAGAPSIGAGAGYFALKSMALNTSEPYYGNCLAYPSAWSSCTAGNVTELGLGTPLNVNLPLPAPATLDASPDAWIKKNEIVGRNLVTLQPTDITTYYGVTEAGTDLFLTSSVILSATNKGLPIASFAVGSQLSHRAGYFGFEPYETAGTAGSAAYCTDANWNCAGGEITSFTTSNVQPHAGSQYSYWSKSGGITVSPVTFMPAIDIYGQPLDTVVSAWVAPAASQNCTLGFTDAGGNSVFDQSVTGDGSTWYYLEGIIPASTDVGTSVPVAACAAGGAIDDVRFSGVQAGFSATIYDPNAYYRAVSSLADNGNAARAVYDDRDDVMAGYVERLGADHAVSSRMTSGAMAAGFSRFGGFNLLNASQGAPAGVTYDIYSSAVPNSVASVSWAPESSLFCANLPVQSWDTGCPAAQQGTGTFTASLTGSAFGLRTLVERNDASDDPIEIGWQAPGLSNTPAVVFSFTDAAQDLGQFMFFSDRDVTGASDDLATPADATSDIVSLPRDWMIVAYEDNVAVFGDGKLLLSVSGKSDDEQWTVDNYLLTTDQTTITFDTDDASFTNVLAGSAPTLTTAYANAALQPMQSHVLNLMRMTEGESPVASLVDVTSGYLRDGWGRPAVQSLPIYYPANGDSATQMLTYRPGLLPVFDWANGAIYTGENVASDLYAFYATGAGASRTLNPQDPQFAFSYLTRYQEPAGRSYQAGQPGWALSMQAAQSRVTETDYQDWNDANLAQSIHIGDDSTLQNSYNTSTSSSGFGADPPCSSSPWRTPRP